MAATLQLLHKCNSRQHMLLALSGVVFCHGHGQDTTHKNMYDLAVMCSLVTQLLVECLSVHGLG